MRAHLARHARRVLVQQPRSPSCALYSVPTRRRQLTQPIVLVQSRRTFFDNILSNTPPREVRQPDFEPGWMKIMVWRSRVLDNLRPPPTDELVQAWRAFFKGKLSSKIPLNASQAQQCHRLLVYLLKQTPDTTESNPAQLTTNDLIEALDTLRSLRLRERAPEHLDLAKRLYSVLISNIYNAQPDTHPNLWPQYIRTICLYGGSKEAMEGLQSNWDNVLNLSKDGQKLVPVVAQGLAREGLESELVNFVNYAEKNGIPFDDETQAVMVKFYAAADNVSETKYWFEKSTESGERTAEVYLAVSAFAHRTEEREWAVPFFLELGDSKPEKPYWDALLQAILILGQGLKQVETMMLHMADSEGPVKADIKTINGLLRAALDLEDPGLAEDILLLAEENDMKLNGETYLIQMGLRLRAQYLPGVKAAYKNAKKLEPWHSNPELWWEYCQLLNQYLEALCSKQTPDFKLIGEVVNDAEEDQVQLNPQTVATLCVLFLENEQPYDVMDALSIHAFQFSAAEREIVQEAFVKFCLNPERSTARAWTAYQLLRQFFQDLSFERRVSLVGAFFERKRPDMASHVFGHMRQHRNNDYHPKLDTYVMFFEGLGQHPDTEALEMVFNMMKMDTKIQPNTQLYTSLILAHTACNKALQALDFWNEITSSREGPSYASLEAGFWALEHNPGGSKMAHKVWKRIEGMDVDIPPSVFNAYVGAIASGSNLEELQDIILRMGKITGVEPDDMTLGVAFNALPGQELQARFKGWAKMRYPRPWAALEEKGKRLNQDSLCQYKLNRVLKA